MAMRPLLLAAVVGIAAAGAFQPAAAQSRGYVSFSVGTPAPYHGHHYRNHHHRPGYVWVPGHWVSTYRGRVWVQAQYVRVQGYGPRPGRDHGYGNYDNYDTYGNYGNYGNYDNYGGHGGNGVRVIYRSGPNHRVVPRSYYPPGYLSPYDHRPRRGW